MHDQTPIRRRPLLGGLAAAALARPALAQPAVTWPDRPVRLVVPFAAGGSADVAARYLANELGAALGQPFVIENRPGAGAVIGTEAVTKSAPDGYTVLMMSNTQTANETLLPNRPYRLMRDLVAVAPVNVAYHVLVVHPSVAARTAAELIALARARPGALDYASSGPGTPYHIAAGVFLAMAGIEMQHVPFRGSAEARTSVIAGQVPVMFDAIPTMLPHIQGGRVRALAVTGPTRSPLLPDVPPLAETLPGYEASIWLGLMAPTGTPPAIVAHLNAVTTTIMATPATRRAQEALGAEPMLMNPADFDAFLRRDVDRQRDYIRMSHLDAT